MKLQGRPLLAALAILALAVASAVPALASTVEGSFDRALNVSGPAELDVSTGSGNITVRSGTSGKVHVIGRIKAHDEGTGSRAEDKVRALEANPPIEQNGNSIKIGRISDPELRRNVSISYEIETPAETRLAAQTGSGNATVENINGPVKANTGSGNISIRNVASEVRANTGSGDVSMDSVKASAYANTGSGNIHASGVSSRFVGQTGSGDVRLEQSTSNDVKIETGSGNVVARGVHGPLSVETGSGDISVEGIQSSEWKLEAGSGTIRVHLPPRCSFRFLRAHRLRAHQQPAPYHHDRLHQQT